MRFFSNFIDYNAEESSKRNACKKAVTFNDFRKYLKESDTGLVLGQIDLDVLDDDLFATNTIVYVQDKKRMLSIRIGLDLLAGVDKILDERKVARASYSEKELLGPNKNEIKGMFFSETNFDSNFKFDRNSCIEDAKTFLRQCFLDEKSTIKSIKPNTFLNNLFLKSRERKMESLNREIERICIYRCGVTPDEICICLPHGVSKTDQMALNRGWANFVSKKHLEKSGRSL